MRQQNWTPHHSYGSSYLSEEDTYPGCLGSWRVVDGCPTIEPTAQLTGVFVFLHRLNFVKVAKTNCACGVASEAALIKTALPRDDVPGSNCPGGE